jgi:hypothetical protein
MSKLNVELRGIELTPGMLTMRREVIKARRLRRTAGWSVKSTFGDNRHARRATRALGGMTVLPDGRNIKLISVRRENASGRSIGRRLKGATT